MRVFDSLVPLLPKKSALQHQQACESGQEGLRNVFRESRVKPFRVLPSDEGGAVGCNPAFCSSELFCPGQQVEVHIPNLLALLRILKY